MFIGEVRLIKEGEKYILKIWDGSSWEVVGEDSRNFLTSRDVAHGALNNHIQSGHYLQYAGSNTWVPQAVTFSNPFTNIPRVVAQDNILQAGSIKIKDITTTGFNCYVFRQTNDTTRIDWMAIGADR